MVVVMNWLLKFHISTISTCHNHYNHVSSTHLQEKECLILYKPHLHPRFLCLFYVILFYIWLVLFCWSNLWFFPPVFFNLWMIIVLCQVKRISARSNNDVCFVLDQNTLSWIFNSAISLKQKPLCRHVTPT
jgi:hypothetical protein